MFNLFERATMRDTAAVAKKANVTAATAATTNPWAERKDIQRDREREKSVLVDVVVVVVVAHL